MVYHAGLSQRHALEVGTCRTGHTALGFAAMIAHIPVTLTICWPRPPMFAPVRVVLAQKCVSTINREGNHMIKTSVLAATALAALLAGAPAFGQTTAPSPAAPPPSSAAPATTAPSSSAPPSASSQTGASQHSSASGTTVQSAQQALQQGGFYKGTVDGKMGPHTRQAIKSFQQSKGLHATGHLNQKTLTALGVTG